MIFLSGGWLKIPDRKNSCYSAAANNAQCKCTYLMHNKCSIVFTSDGFVLKDWKTHIDKAVVTKEICTTTEIRATVELHIMDQLNFEYIENFFQSNWDYDLKT